MSILNGELNGCNLLLLDFVNFYGNRNYRKMLVNMHILLSILRLQIGF